MWRSVLILLLASLTFTSRNGKLSLLHSWVNFKLGSKLLRCSKNVLVCLPHVCVQIKKISSMYLNHSRRLFSWLLMKLVSNLHIKVHAQLGPYLVSLTVPVNSKALVLRTNSAIFKSFSVGIDLFSQAWRAFLRVFHPATWGMQEYNPITSGVTKIASLDCFWSYLFFYLKSLESPIED